MTSEEHKAIARRFFDEVWNQQKLEAIDDIFAATLVLNGQVVARDAIRQVVAARRAAFPDIHVTVEDQLAEGDKVSTRRTWQGTHQGPYRGIVPTGKRVKWTQISVVRFADGKIVEDWAVADELGILQQLGQSLDDGILLGKTVGGCCPTTWSSGPRACDARPAAADRRLGRPATYAIWQSQLAGLELWRRQPLK